VCSLARQDMGFGMRRSRPGAVFRHCPVSGKLVSPILSGSPNGLRPSCACRRGVARTPHISPRRSGKPNLVYDNDASHEPGVECRSGGACKTTGRESASRLAFRAKPASAVGAITTCSGPLSLSGLGNPGILHSVNRANNGWRSAATVLSACAVAFLIEKAVGAEASFPVNQTVLTSPNGKLHIKNVDPSDDVQTHKLILSTDGKPDREIYGYGRSVDVSWSPNSRYISVTDFAGSSESTCVLIDVQAGTSMDLRLLLRAASPKAAAILSNIHSYLECVRWLSSSEVLVKIHGYSGSTENEDELSLGYEIGGGFRAP